MAEEGHIDFQFIQEEIVKHIEGGIAAAEIVQPALIAGPAEIGDGLSQGILALYQGGLGDFNAQQPSWQLIAFHHFLHVGQWISCFKIHTGQVDGHRHHRKVIVPPERQKRRHLLQNIPVQLINNAGILQHRYEKGRRQESLFRILPAGKGLHAAEFSRQRADHRLEIHLDMLSDKGPVELAQHIGPILQLRPHGRLICHKALRPVFLDGIAGNFCHVKGIPKDGNRRHLIVKIADARLQLHAGIIDIPVHLENHGGKPLRQPVL